MADKIGLNNDLEMHNWLTVVLSETKQAIKMLYILFATSRSGNKALDPSFFFLISIKTFIRKT